MTINNSPKYSLTFPSKPPSLSFGYELKSYFDRVSNILFHSFVTYKYMQIKDDNMLIVRRGFNQKYEEA